ncbi:MAG TPA: BrxA/BrxB family bacilliredoxin [Bacteroidota bacterium]|nr:BrxA/BrxB family bacilliredoxin [Bacteroidota bacterium]
MGMAYDSVLIQPFRDELTEVGIRELRTSSDVEAELRESKGTVLVVVNSVCGCAAGKARPGVRIAMEQKVRPEKAVSVFAGQDKEATEYLREKFLNGLPPSSPSIALFKDGELVHFVPRHRIENRLPNEIALDLITAFNEYCA